MADFWITGDFWTQKKKIALDGTDRYARLLLAPAEGFGLEPRLFMPFGHKKSFSNPKKNSRIFLLKKNTYLKFSNNKFFNKKK